VPERCLPLLIKLSGAEKPKRLLFLMKNSQHMKKEKMKKEWGR